MKIKYLAIFLISVLCLNSFAIEGVYEVIIKKQQEKKSSRWSIASYLAQKKRISLMDQWLALNTESNIFEMILDYGAFEHQEQGREVTDNQFKASFYASILGVEFSSQNQSNQLDNYHYNLTLRFFGSSSQSTHVNFLYGKANTEHDDYGSFSSTFYGFEADLYLLSFLGLSGRYENSSKSSSSDISMHFENRNYGVFVELWLLRIYFQKKSQSYKYSSQLERRDGNVIGVSLYL